MGERVRVSNDSPDSYGTRVLTSGMNVEQYCRSPVLLYMHEHGNVIGYMKDVKVEDDGVTGELVFDEATKLSRRYKRRFESGSLKMVNASLDIIEINEDGTYLVARQTSPTITKSELFGVSAVDIEASDGAFVLKEDGKRITLGRDEECPLPELSNNNQKTKNEVENKVIALRLSPPGTTTDAEIAEKIDEFEAAKEGNESLRKEKDELTLASITSFVEKTIGKKHITADKKNGFINLGKEIGVGKLTSVFLAISLQVKLSVILGQHGTTKTDVPTTYKKLSEVPGDKLLEMHEQQPDECKQLYEAEYRMEYEIQYQPFKARQK